MSEQKSAKDQTRILAKDAPASASGTFDIGGDMPVRRMGFGAMRITGKGVWGEPKDHGEAIRVLRKSVELGINLIDTADSYGPHVSERLIAEALHPYPADLVIATKAGFDRSGPDKWTMNGKPAHLRKACEGSLQRLKLERIDLYQLHRIDPNYPAEDQLGTLKELQHEGKIRHIGLSEVTVAQLQHARKIVPIVSVQNRYSVTDRAAEDVLELCEQENIGFIPWFPLAAGKLAEPGGPLSRVASELKITTSQLALAWLLWRSKVMLPIPGTSSLKHLGENVAAAGVNVDETRMKALGQLAQSA
ncbi:MAG TPA: aldo/keto reductase [Candidatus Acidoferrum sp.]|nr:aldo/keto reductase [Candidatus Acidoferrum sp.]